MATTMGFLFDWQSMGSLYGTLMLVRTTLREFLPPKAYEYLRDIFNKIMKFFPYFHRNEFTMEIDGGAYGDGGFATVQTYLSSKCFDSSLKHIRTTTVGKPKKASYSIAPDTILTDTYDNIKFEWKLLEREVKGYCGTEKHVCFQLFSKQKYKKIIHENYLPYIKKEAKRIDFENRGKYLFTNRENDSGSSGGSWSKVSRFKHPSTFNTIAIDPVLKQEIKLDLDNFVSRKKYYTRVGRSWKRGYLFYGPPGTGKTSLIAAIANYLKFDIYDMELTAVKTNSDLRKLLVATKSKSVIVIEDIDCSLEISSRGDEESTKSKEQETTDDAPAGSSTKTGKKKKNGSQSKVSLSGLLNFVDGLWSSCGGERLIIFTTNYKDKLDPALLRPGRMDKHIHLSFCDFESFKVLAKNYLQIKEHESMDEVKELLKFVRITPADVAEFLMNCDENPDTGLRNLVEELKKRFELIKSTGDVNEENFKETADHDDSERLKMELTNDDKEEEEDEKVDSDNDDSD